MRIPGSILEPRLPQDLERTVFEFAAYSERRSIPLLIQVARRVKAWLEPILYEIAILHGYDVYKGDAIANFYYNCPLHPPGLQPHYIKHLLIEYGRRPGDEYILKGCYNVQSLTIWGTEQVTWNHVVELLRSPRRTVSPPGLLRLSAAMLKLFPQREVDFNHDILQDITHLDVLDASAVWQEGNNYACLKHLRYLSFQEISDGILVILRRCLEECKALEVLLLYYSQWGVDERVANQLPRVRRVARPNGVVEEIEEDRVVILPHEDIFQHNFSWIDDWIRGVTGGEDLWLRAERIVKERRQKTRALSGTLGQ
ncbi:hypothetical protein AX16_008977 [Volvariella volvacea WC 439]|nr:hypothetical protein AX16_008977 [Volvariella volvacea WC 439]